ncbi:MAG: thioesterase family protein, partial [Nitrospinota bacterium]
TDFPGLKIGLAGEASWPVEEETSTRRWGLKGLAVFATPDMVHLVEKAASLAVEPFLPEGWITVGTRVEVSHLAATPVGLTATARAELVEVDRRRLVFRVEVSDEVEKVGEGVHERFIVHSAKVNEKMTEKAARKPSD